MLFVLSIVSFHPLLPFRARSESTAELVPEEVRYGYFKVECARE